MLRYSVSSALFLSRYSTTTLALRQSLFHHSAIDSAETASSPAPKVHDINESARGSTDRAYADRTRKQGFSRINTPEAVYDLFKQLVSNQRSVHSRGVVTNALRGVLDGNFVADFVVNYFEAWWKEFVFHLEDPHTDFFLINNINTLGRINGQTNGELTKYFSVKVLQFIVSKFSTIDFTAVRPVDLFVFYNGMSLLTIGQPILNAKIITDDLIEKTLNVLSTVDPQTRTQNLLEVANAYAAFINCLTKFGGSLTKNQFEKTIQFFKTVFDDKEFQSLDDVSSIVFSEYPRKSRILYNFAEAFLAFRINPDRILDGTLTSWFACWKNFLTFNVNMQHWNKKPGEKWEINLLKRVRFVSTETINICNSAAEFATIFDKERALEDSWALLMKALIKNLPYATSDTVSIFSNTLRRAVLHLEMKSVVDPNFHSEAKNLIDNQVIQLISQKVEDLREYRRSIVLKQHHVSMSIRQDDQRSFDVDERGGDGGLQGQNAYRSGRRNF